MSTYKPFTTSDVVITPFKTNKSFSFQGASALTASNVGINRFLGKNIQSTLWVSGSNPTGQIFSYNKELIYESIKQLYYSNYLKGEDGSPATTASMAEVDVYGATIEGVYTYPIRGGAYQPMYDNYLSNTLDANRLFPTASNDEIGVISIPSNLFGEYIKPSTFKFQYSGSFTSGIITDDGEGGLFNAGLKVGDIIYQHGIAILTSYGSSITGSVYGTALYGTGSYGTSDAEELNQLLTSANITCSFQSTTNLHESQYKCTLRENEYNYTLNPSSISGSSNSGKVYDFLTGSYFEPYVTTVGLYNNAYDLIAIGKLAQPLQSSMTTDTTILVNIDL